MAVLLQALLAALLWRAVLDSCHIKPFWEQFSALPEELLELKFPLLHICFSWIVHNGLFKHQHNFLKSAQFQDISDRALQSTQPQLNIPQKATAKTKDKSCALTAFHLTKDINYSPQGSMPQGWDYTALHHLSECCNETSGLPSLHS